MKIATSGVGLRGGHVLQQMLAAMPEATMVGYHDPAPRHLDMIGGEAIPSYPSVGDMLAETQPDLFCVFSPNCFHLEQIREGLEAGALVFAEKPIVTTIEDSFALAELLAKYGANRVIVGLVLRYSSHMVDLRAAMANGALGTIASMEANEHIGPYHGAFFMRDWRRHTKLSGGFMLEKCCHDIDIYNMIADARPARVASFGARRSFVPENAPGAGKDAAQYHSKSSYWQSTDDPFTSDGDIIDSQTALIEYESGASLAFHTNLNVPDEHRRFCVIGSRGMAEGDFLRGYLNITDARSGKQLVAHDYSASATNEGHYGADEMMVRDIAAFLRNETDSLPVSVLDALEAGITALAIDEARRTKSVIELGDQWARLDALGLIT